MIPLGVNSGAISWELEAQCSNYLRRNVSADKRLRSPADSSDSHNVHTAILHAIIVLAFRVKENNTFVLTGIEPRSKTVTLIKKRNSARVVSAGNS